MAFTYYQPPAGGGSDDQTAAEVSYSPDNGAYWTPDPDNVGDALDQAVIGSAVFLAALTDPTAEAGDAMVSSGGSVAWRNIAEAAVVNTGSYWFDGTDDSMSIANASSPNLYLGDTDFTIEAWIHMGSITGDNTICSRWEESDNASKNFLFRYDGSSRLELAFYDTSVGFQLLQSGVERLEDSGWNHVAVTWDASVESATFYVNGRLSATDTITLTGSIQDGTADFVVGAEDGGFDHFEGHINLLRVWGDIRTRIELNTNMHSIIGAVYRTT